jgi:sialate O-acetylesterase
MYYKDREYMIPEDKLIENTKNTIAIRVYDSHLEGGILSGRVGLFYNYDDKYIDIPLSGTWKFKTGKNKDWNKRKFPDSDWDEINVPQNWDSQGYEDYDGDACYRKTFNIPAGADIKNQYLVLGKIDDYDKVYLNGEYIGSYKTVKHDFNYSGEKDAWRNIRYYPIPDNLLVKGENYISVNVHDTHLSGGIYDGPVGITSKSNYQKLKSKYKRDRNIWEVVIESLKD